MWLWGASIYIVRALILRYHPHTVLDSSFHTIAMTLILFVILCAHSHGKVAFYSPFGCRHHKLGSSTLTGSLPGHSVCFIDDYVSFVSFVRDYHLFSGIDIDIYQLLSDMTSVFVCFPSVMVVVKFNFLEKGFNEGKSHYEFNTSDIHTLAQKKSVKSPNIEDSVETRNSDIAKPSIYIKYTPRCECCFVLCSMATKGFMFKLWIYRMLR